MNYVILSDYFSYVSNFKFHNFIILKYDKVIYLDKPKYTNNYRQISHISQSISKKNKIFSNSMPNFDYNFKILFPKTSSYIYGILILYYIPYNFKMDAFV